MTSPTKAPDRLATVGLLGVDGLEIESVEYVGKLGDLAADVPDLAPTPVEMDTDAGQLVALRLAQSSNAAVATWAPKVSHSRPSSPTDAGIVRG